MTGTKKSSAKRRVLIIEDDSTWQERLRDIFHRDLGFEVTIVEAYHEVVVALKQPEPFDVITIDMNLSRKTTDRLEAEENSDLLLVPILNTIALNFRGERCLIISGENLPLDLVNQLDKYSHILVKDGKLSKRDGRELRTKLLVLIPALLEMRGRHNNIFISYRRSDSQDIAGRIHDRLIQHFHETQSQTNVFIDVHDIAAGRDFRLAIQDRIAICNVMLVVIGKTWSASTDENGRRRLDDRNDYVRIEVAEALDREDQGLRVIPVLVHDAAMPQRDDLPLELAELCYRHAMTVRSDGHFHSDIQALISELNK